jgi:hypothetical protein
MKIRSVLLGTAAIAGLTTAGYAADLGVVTSLDVCDSLSISGLTISSDDNCLQISGNISFEYDYGNYNDLNNDQAILYGPFERTRDGGPSNYKFATTLLGGTHRNDSAVDLDLWLKFVATADSDFGPATATLKLVNNNWNFSGTTTIAIKEAWVGVGDTTKLMAGYKGSIFNNGDDTPLNYLGLFNSSQVSTGVGFYDSVGTGGMSIQVTSDLGNGLMIGGGIENLNTPHSGFPHVTTVGVLSYSGDGLTAHVSGAFDQHQDWNIHAGFTGTFDKVKVVGAIAADNDYGSKAGIWWNALGSVSIDLDMFTLAGSVEATSVNEWGAGASLTATVSDGVKLNVGGRYFTNTASGIYIAQVEAGVSAAVTEAITLSGSIGAYQDNDPGADYASDFYGKGQLSWNPKGGFASSASLEVHSSGAYKAVFKASKSIN